MIIYLISFLYLILWGFTSIHGRVGKLGIGEKPLMYTSILIESILNLFFILFLISTIALFIYSWKLAILLFVIGVLTCRIVFDPLVERVLFLPLFSYLLKKGKEIEDRENKLKS
ncbi:hypothetical protein L6255_04415 [Candidatus Parcubacteria bacterium]|nr:hypothetical protein [Patescibacteria group bacterium]MCG2689651.1 hypothetical protein [Candidatus Parcubacteria bacterium]